MVTTTVTSIVLNPDEFRRALTGFWSEQLAIERDRNGLILALPLMLPDGVQIAIEARPIAERSAILTDAGDVLRWLSTRGMNLKTEGSKQWIDERLAAFELKRSGYEIFREIPLPVQGIDVHLFGEALVSIAHLICRHEPQQAVAAPADEQVARVFHDTGIAFQRNAKLTGTIEEAIEVDYYFEYRAPSAIEVIGKGGRILDTMERWGYRWHDLKHKNPKLRSAMIYDPERQTIDPTSRRIGEECCELFCAYHETDRILEFVKA
jgi:hypothetical protein